MHVIGGEHSSGLQGMRGLPADACPAFVAEPPTRPPARNSLPKAARQIKVSGGPLDPVKLSPPALTRMPNAARCPAPAPGSTGLGKPLSGRRAQHHACANNASTSDFLQ
ncbi:hypothetical protein GCM10011581_49810 [Saccharopolyspora subtropica]|uniref:Uncharacterized protein n=1 Tax=Saccharopolyspora thermophila TaxID=89367 RepID=A0A917NK03_9PSEU|nr:hypothetical protein GCM10011581_49810 [Saccharopolyspora subtropica]